MDTPRKNLLIRVDCIPGEHRGGERHADKRRHRILSESLPRLIGCTDRAPRAECICLHNGESKGSFSGWVRVPIQRRPRRKIGRKFEAKLRSRLEVGLQPIDARILDVSIRRCRTSRPIESIQQSLPFFEADILQSA